MLPFHGLGLKHPTQSLCIEGFGPTGPIHVQKRAFGNYLDHGGFTSPPPRSVDEFVH